MVVAVWSCRWVWEYPAAEVHPVVTANRPVGVLASRAAGPSRLVA